MQAKSNVNNVTTELVSDYNHRLAIYKEVKLTANLSHLSAQQKNMLLLLIEASDIMDELFWKQALGENKNQFLAKITNPKVKEFAAINYGPWDRLDGDAVFLSGYEKKSHGTQFYPNDLTKTEFEQQVFTDKNGLYSVVKRDKDGQLITIAYSEFYEDELNRAASILKKSSSTG